MAMQAQAVDMPQNEMSREEILAHQKKFGMQFCCVGSDVLWSVPIESKVMVENRVWRDYYSAGFFLCILFAQIVIAFVLIGSADPTVCGSITQAQFNDLMGMNPDNAGFGNMLELYLEAFIGLVFVIIFIAMIWLAGLMFCAKAVTWITLVTDFLVVLAVAIFIFTQLNNVGSLVFIIVLDLAFAGYFFAIRQRVGDAADLMQNAAYVIKNNPSLAAVIFSIMLLIFAYAALMIAGIISSFLVWNCDDPTFGVGILWAPWAINSRTFLSVTMVWTFFVLCMMRSYICSATAAAWCWHTDLGFNMPCKALSWALSKSFGSLAISGLIVTIIDRAVAQSKSCCANCMNCCNPFWWLLRIAIWVFKEYISALTRFSLAFAAITGENFWTSAQRALFNLKGRFVKLFLIDSTAKLVLFSGSTIFASCIAFATFDIGFTYSPQYGGNCLYEGNGDIISGILFNPCNYAPNNSLRVVFQILAAFTWLFGLSMMYYPLTTTIIVCLFTGPLAIVFGYAFIFAIFVGSLANFMLGFFAGTILDIVTALFVIGIVNEQNGGHLGDASAAQGSAGYVLLHISKRIEEPKATAVGGTAAIAAVGGAAPVVYAQPAAQAVYAQPAAQGAPMYAQPVAQAAPVYAQPAGHATPIYAQPAGQVAYAQPAYGQPAAGAPAYGAPAPAYGAPAYGAPAYGGGAPAYGGGAPQAYATAPDAPPAKQL